MTKTTKIRVQVRTIPRIVKTRGSREYSMGIGNKDYPLSRAFALLLRFPGIFSSNLLSRPVFVARP